MEGHGASQQLLPKRAGVLVPEEGGLCICVAAGTAAAAVGPRRLGGPLEGGHFGAGAQSIAAAAAAAAVVVGPNGLGGEGVWQ